VIRIAAVGDIHVSADSAGTQRPHFEHLAERADLFLLAGDLTKRGQAEEAAVLADELLDLGLPVIAVLGNHDYHSDAEADVVEVMASAGVVVLEGASTVLDIGGQRVGVAGAKGFGGGFPGASGSDFGEREMKAFMRHSQSVADSLEHALRDVTAQGVDVRIALMHYSPVEATLAGERREIYPFLGSYLLAEAVDRVGADLVVHGHAHAGSERGETPGGVPVRNVAQPVLRRAYSLFCLGADDDANTTVNESCEPSPSTNLVASAPGRRA
jgi:Icc-related predicted phosphoesterase